MAKLKAQKVFGKLTLFVFLITSIVLIFILVLNLPFLKKIYPNTYVAGLYIGNLSKDEAKEKINSTVNLPPEINLVFMGKKNIISTSEIVPSVNTTNTIERVYNFTNSGNFLLDMYNKILLVFKPRDFALSLDIKEEKLLETILIMSNEEGVKPVYPSAKKIGNEIIIDKGIDGVEIDYDEVRKGIGLNLSRLKNSDIAVKATGIKVQLSDNEIALFKSRAEKLLGKNIYLTVEENKHTLDTDLLISFITKDGINTELVKKEVSILSEKVNRGPQDSVFVVENDIVKEFKPSLDGLVINESELIKSISNTIGSLINSDITEATIEVPINKRAAKIRNEDVNNLGIKELIGTGFSNFRGSIPNRIFNVNHAQSKFKGVLIPPGEVASFNQILGDVSALTGYKSAYVILAGKTVLGDGGGVCQVSTTLFRAALDAGLPIIERRAHAYRVGYYEQGFGPGLDATVYSPTTDFKFKNDTPGHLLIQPEIDLNNLSLTFKLYGTSDGRVATTTKPIITSSIAPGEDIYQDDPTLKVGIIKQIEHRAYGARVVFDYDVTRNGETLIDQTFVSNYRPWQAVYLRGTMP